MMILALDLGTKTGWAIGAAGAVHASGTWDLRGGRYEGGGMRFLRLRAELDKVANLARIERVGYEEVRRHMGVDAAHIYGGMQAVLTSWCEDRLIAYQAIPVGTIKKHATGRGNADKAAMLEAMAAHAPADDNEADALALFFLLTSLEGGCKKKP